jgi:hypothetical protein
MILMRMEKVSRDVLMDVSERAWRLVAPARLMKQRDAVLASAKT